MGGSYSERLGEPKLLICCDRSTLCLSRPIATTSPSMWRSLCVCVWGLGATATLWEIICEQQSPRAGCLSERSQWMTWVITDDSPWGLDHQQYLSLILSSLTHPLPSFPLYSSLSVLPSFLVAPSPPPSVSLAFCSSPLSALWSSPHVGVTLAPIPEALLWTAWSHFYTFLRSKYKGCQNPQ